MIYSCKTREIILAQTERRVQGVSYRSFVLVQHLIVLGHGDAEDDGGHVLEAVDPLLTLAPLPADIEQSRRKDR